MKTSKGLQSFNGSPEPEYGLILLQDFDAFGVTGRPGLIATPLPLKEFPVDNTTGLPDTAQLFSQGGTFHDLGTGDINLDTPPFKVGQQLAIGFPDGQTSGLASPIFLSVARLGGVFIEGIHSGCVITFMDADNTPITSASEIMVSTSATSGTVFSPNRGDTIYVVPHEWEKRDAQ